jgi:hypothetical protein
MGFKRPLTLSAGFALTPLLALPTAGEAATPVVAHPLCPVATAFYDPDQGKDIVVPPEFTVSVFAKNLNMPTGIAFLGNSNSFEVYVLESGHGLPSVCNDQSAFGTGDFDPTNPFTPDIRVFNKNGTLLRTLGKPTAPGVGFQPEGPAIDIAFERGLQGGRLFATDSNQATHTSGANNNSSRIVTVDPTTGKVTAFITGLPTGDHPTEQLAFAGRFIYWSQGSTTQRRRWSRQWRRTGQPDIPWQDIVLSDNVFDSGGGVKTSGYSKFGTQNPGGTVKAFTGALHPGVCDGAILRAQLNAKNPADTIEPFSWGYRNGYAIRFPPNNHPFSGGLLVGEDGPDERGARPSNNAPDVLQLAKQNDDGTPDYHGWPDRFGFLPSSQAVFNPIGGPSDDLCQNPPNMSFPACTATVLKEDVPIANVLKFPPQQITSPLAIEGADSSFTGIDFAPKSFVRDPVEDGAALYSLEGDFGFSPPNATAPAPEIGHEVKLINFDQKSDKPLALKIQNFARNDTGDQAFISPDHPAGFNRPTNIRFGPDGCAYVVDYGAVRDAGADTHVVGAKNGPLVQINGTGVVFKICPQ